MNKPLSEIMNGSRREINAYYRSTDESHLWPVCGRFNVTERAIRTIRRFERESGDTMWNWNYFAAIENEISRIVNAEV